MIMIIMFKKSYLLLYKKLETMVFNNFTFFFNFDFLITF